MSDEALPDLTSRLRIDTTDLADAVGRAAKSGSAIGSALGTAVGEGLSGIVGGLGGKAADLFGDALGREASGDKLAGQLGLTGEEAARAAKVAGDSFANNYGESLDQVNEAVKGVALNIGTSINSPDFEGINNKVLNLASTFDQDLGGTTKAVGQLIKTGLAKDATEALDIVTRGFQTGADASGDFLDTLNEYGTQFRKLGIDGATATGLISQGLKAGARDGDLVADALKEFAIRAVDGSATTSAAFKGLGLDAGKLSEAIASGGPAANAGLTTVLEKLKAIKDPAKQAQLATGLFGTQAEDLGKALFALDPTTAVSAIGDVTGAADQLDKTINGNASANLAAFGRQLQTALVDVLAKYVIPALTELTGILSRDVAPVLKTVGDALGDVGRFVKDNAAPFEAFGAVIGVAAVAFGAYSAAVALGTLATEGMAAAQLLLNLAVSANPIGLIVIAIAALAAGLVLAYQNSETFRAVIQKIGDFFTGSLLPAIQKLGPVVSEVVDIAKAYLQGFVDQIKGFIDIIVGLFTGDFGRVLDGVKEVFTGLFEQFTAIPLKLLPIVVDLGGKLLDAAKTAFGYLLSELLNAIVALGALMLTLPGKLVDALAALPGLLKTAATTGFNAIFEALKLAIQGYILVMVGLPVLLVKALINLGPALLGAATTGFKAILTALTTAVTGYVSFMITLPGKLVTALAQLGPLLLKAGTAGFQKLRDAIDTGVRSLVTLFVSLPGRLISAAGDIAGVFGKLGRAIVQGVIDGVTGLAGTLLQKVKDLAGSIASSFASALHIKSPSRVFAEFGENIVLGLVRGIDAQTAGAVGTMQGLADTLAGVPFTATLDSAGVGASTAGSGASRKDSSGGDVYNVTVSLDVDDLAEFQTAAEFFGGIRQQSRALVSAR